MNKPIYAFLTLIFASLLIFPLYGMETTSKEAAQEIIQNLLFEKAQLKTKLYSPNIDQEEKITISQQITEINKQIHEQKVITGEKWSNKKNILWKGIKTVACLITGLVVVTLIKNKYDDLHKQLSLTKANLTGKKNDFNALQKKHTDTKKELIREFNQQLNKKKIKIKNLTEQITSLSQEIEKYWKLGRDLIRFKLYIDNCVSCKQVFLRVNECKHCKNTAAQLSTTIDNTIYKNKK